MVRNRKVPKSRRHKKLKFVDPCYSGERPQAKKKNLLPNEPPTEDDYQEVSRHTTEIINLKNRTKANKLKKRKKKKKILKDDFIVVSRDTFGEDIQGASKPIKKVPDVVKQKKNESEERFFNRLQRMADSAIAEAKIEEKYDIELVNIDKKGNAQYVTASKETSEKKREKRKKYKERKDEKKKMKTGDTEFDLKKEDINFGEVAMEPPMFTAKPKKAPDITKPGKKQLFLKNILSSGKNEDSRNPHSSTEWKNKSFVKAKMKWKDMSPEKRKNIESERSRAIQMYRMLKNKKSNS